MAKRIKAEQAVLSRILDNINELRALAPGLSKPATSKTVLGLSDLVAEIESTKAALDPIKDPGTSFDPANPDTAGRLVAIALMAQDRVPLGMIAKAYGSGVYAIYYTGDHPVYAAVSGTEVPMYVGKADPKRTDAVTPKEQGPQLFGRLADHRKMIKTVGAFARDNDLSHPLDIDKFECRRLVCATNAQLVAERHLIAAFKPVWNSETKICWGISMHGDREARSNSRPPWDVLHPGRAWTQDPKKRDSMPLREIEEKVAAHFATNPPVKDRKEIIERLLLSFAQHAPMVDSEEQADADDEAVASDTTLTGEEA